MLKTKQKTRKEIEERGTQSHVAPLEKREHGTIISNN